MKPIFTEAESKAIEHISRQCGHTWKAAMALSRHDAGNQNPQTA